MIESLLFYHAQGQISGFHSFADELRQTGDTVHTPDLYDGRTFATLEAGIGNEIGFGNLLQNYFSTPETSIILPTRACRLRTRIGRLTARASRLDRVFTVGAGELKFIDASENNLELTCEKSGKLQKHFGNSGWNQPA